MLCDLGIACVLYAFARGQKLNRNQAGVLGLLAVFNPVLVLNSAAWGQVDSVLALLLMLVALLAIRRKWIALMPVYMLAVLVKPQALMLGFLGLAAIVMDWLRHKEDRKPMLIGTGVAVVLALLVVLPFQGEQESGWLINLYAGTLSSYAYATVNTANLYYLFGANWSAIENTAAWGVCAILAVISAGWGAWCFVTLRRCGRKAFWLEPVLMVAFTVFFLICAISGSSWAVMGYGAMALAFAMVLPMFLRAGKMELLPLAGGLLFLLLYVLGIKMHERYLFPAVAFFLMAYAVKRDSKVLLLLLLTTATMLVNEGIVLDNSVRLGSSMGHLNNDTYVLNMILSGLNLLAVPLGLWCAMDAFYLQRQEAEQEHAEKRLPLRRFEAQPRRLDTFHTDPSLHWKKLDTVLILAGTAIYALVAFWNLGSTKAPQSAWTTTTPEESVTIDLGRYYEDFSMLYYCGVSYADFYVETSDDGETWS